LIGYPIIRGFTYFLFLIKLIDLSIAWRRIGDGKSPHRWKSQPLRGSSCLKRYVLCS